MAELFKGFPCQVCKAPSSGVHFGSITCEGCKVSQINEIIYKSTKYFIQLNENIIKNE